MTDATLETTMTIRWATSDALAKINLTLDVLGRRDDGFHELRSLVVGVAFQDHIRCQVGCEPGLSLTCSDPELEGDDNLVVRAATSLAEHVGLNPACAIELQKNIPVGGGLGGGSSDAASTLRLCNELWGCGLSDVQLATIGAELGSDVPLFFSLPAAWLTGRGECVEPVTLSWSGWVLLVFVDTHVSTVDVYRAWRVGDAVGEVGSKDEDLLRATSADEMSVALSNSLEPAVFRVAPSVAEVWERLNCAEVGPFRVSGAGSTLYRLFDNEEAARQAAQGMECLGLGITTVVVTAPVAPGPIVTEEH